MRLLLTVALVALSVGASAQSSTYELGPDSQRQPGVPRGEIEHLRWEDSTVYPNTERDWWIYVPRSTTAKHRRLSWCSRTARGI